jgi:biopolymer transport protein ExbD
MRIPLPNVRRRARIEIIPLIDIIFFLLATFVMVSLSMVHNQGISINLPVASTSTDQDPKPIVTISVNEKGDIYLDKEVMSVEAWSARLKQLKSKDPGVRVLVNGDDKADFGQAIAVLDEVRRVGITKVSIRTKRN